MKFRNGLLFLILTIVWGSAFTAIKAGLEFIPPVLFAAIRFDLAGILMLLYALYATDHWLPKNRRELTVIGVGGVFLIAAYHAFLFVGEQGTTSAAAAIIVSLSPILTTGFSRVFLPEERLTAVGTVGLLIGLVGVIILSNPDPSNLFDTRTVSLLLIFLAATAFALGSVLTRRYDTEMPIETMEAWSMVVGAIILHIGSVAYSETLREIQWTNEAIVSLVYLSVVASAIGFLIYFDLLDRLGPIEINLVSYATPVMAAITGFVFLSETPTVLTVIGFGLILVGFILLKRRTIRQEFSQSPSFSD